MAKSSVLEAKPLSESGRKTLAQPSNACHSDCPLVVVCRKCKGHEEVIAFLQRHTRAEVRTVRCQKVCEEPVAGLRVDGRMEYFEKVDGPKQLKALAELLRQKPPTRLPKALKKRRSRERSGRLPR